MTGCRATIPGGSDYPGTMRTVLPVWLFLAGLLAAAELSTAEKIKQGHSRHGEQFDEGPRERPWEMPAIGR